MDVGDGGHDLFAGGLVIVDAIVLGISAFCLGIHMSFDLPLIGFCGICICLHALIGFLFFAICLLVET